MSDGRLLSLAAGVCPETPPVEFVTAAAAAGWPACGIWFDPDTWTVRTATTVRRRLDDTGLVALDLEPVFVTERNGEPVDEGELMIEAAAAVGARHLLVVGRDIEPGAFTQRFGELCDAARSASETLVCVVEFMAFMSITTLGDAMAVLDTVDRPNAGVLVDNLHLARTGGDASDLAGIDPLRLPYVQLCDAAAGTPAGGLAGLIGEALDERLVPGSGSLPLDDVLGTIAPATPLSLEVRSADLRNRFADPTDRARHVLDATRSYLERREHGGAERASPDPSQRFDRSDQPEEPAP